MTSVTRFPSLFAGSLILVAAQLVPDHSALAQIPPDSLQPPPTTPVGICATPVPFGVGERMEFSVQWGVLSVGEAQVAVTGVDTVRGHPTYVLDWTLQGGIPLARVNDHYRSWMDVRSLASRRYIQDIHQIRRERLRHFELYPEERRYDFVGVEEGLDLLSDTPLDDISFVFYLRTLPLELDEELTFNRYFREHGNPVRVQVRRREEVTVSAGTFPSVVVRPIIRSRGLWDEDSEAEVHLSDDDDRRILRVRMRAPALGSLTMELASFTPGEPLRGIC